MFIYQIYFKVFLLQSISQEDSLAAIASFIDHVLIKDKRWEKVHNQNQYKEYCFNSFFRPESDGIYKKEKVYQIMIRTINPKLAQYLAENLPKHDNPFMKGLVCNVIRISQKHITTLYSITPVVVKGENQKYWRDELSFTEFDNRLKVNLLKKYRSLLQLEMNESFQLHTLLEIKNHSPIAVPYKGIKLLADKIQMQVADNSQAQNLAFLALGVGLGEMNARGMGFVNAHFM